MTETFCERMAASAQARPDKTAMTLFGRHGVETFTYGLTLERIRNLAYRLDREGIAFGDRIVLFGENHPDWVTTYLGILYRGAVVVPLDPAAPLDSLVAFMRGSEARLAFVSTSSLEKFKTVCGRLDRPVRIVKFQSDDPAAPDTYDDWARTPAPPEFVAAKPPAKPENLAVLIYTSGTTGVSKAVALTHGNIYAEADSLQSAMKFEPGEVILGLLPLFHAYSQVAGVWVGPIIGAEVVFITELNSAEIERALKQGGITALLGVPRLWYLFHKKIFDAVRAQAAPIRMLFGFLLSLNGFLRDVLNVNAGRLFFKRVHDGFGGKLRLAVSAGAAFDPDVARDFHRLGFTLLQGYGLSETAGAATATRFEDNRVGSVGKPLGTTEVKIDEPNAEGVGEVLIRGPIVMPGYYRNPEANGLAFTPDGWFRSGDLGRFDAKGNLYILGRCKDVVKLPSGKNVFPDDVEAHYAKSPLVAEISVLGVKDESAGFKSAEKLCAVIVPDFAYLKANRVANARELIRFELDGLGRELPEYQRVRDYVVRVEPLPRTATGKVRRFELRRQVEADGGLDQSTRKPREQAFTSADTALMDSPAGRAIAEAVRRQAAEAGTIHPAMNLELDLGLDSLARAECVVAVQHALGIALDPSETVSALTVGELIALANSKASGNGSAPARLAPTQPDWGAILTETPEDLPEVRPILKRKPVTTMLLYLLLRVVYWTARVLLRMEVSGAEHVRNLKRPFLVCPNHQSFLDAILVCSTYSYDVLAHVFHVGASEYFTNAFLLGLAHRFNIIPIDPDAHLLTAMQAGAAGLKAGKILNVYPEGQRSFDGKLDEFKKGPAILARELNLPLVPVALDGLHRVWPRGSWVIRPAKVKIRFGEPLDARAVAPAGDKEAAHTAVTAALKAAIQRMLDDMRSR